MEFGVNDFVYCQSGGEIHAGGYLINSNLLKNGGAPMQTINNNTIKGGSISSALKDLAVPTGLLYLQQTMSGKKFQDKHSEVVSDNLFDKLFNLAQVKPKQKLTKKRRIISSRKTHKNKNS